ncbi:DarT ssDNA thymidine ADP-ribosyltransferase family protein [Shewanella algae]|uniref:DarT ssDNA thymidine ADP-ribosyltransferase family protein n=1 Tax=Shewanella algae TaxID=38313 RepID=UPI001BED8A27|nr:hypothetical protein TUM17383_36340 [Shewanella algae]
MPGVQGFEALFEPTITKWQNCSVHRSHSLPTFYTTCEQAEVLYPKECSTEYLQRIYVQNDDDLQQIDAMIGFVDHHAVEVIVDPSKFGNQT